MCTFLSGYISHTARVIYPGDLVHHENGEELHGLTAALKSSTPPLPWEWPRDNPESLSIRVPALARHNEEWYKARLLRRFPTRDKLISHCLRNLPPNLANLYLYNTPVKVLPDMPNLTWLELYHTPVKALPNMPNLTWLELYDTPVTVLPDMPNLTRLKLSNTPIKRESLTPQQLAIAN